ncbi:putative 15-hydroxyprostaglandin dehydrogenase [Leptodontidium sp. 2 PMI_412]|nr:putative 15-hydroxyprostaglandin dehydrogenase [Leptodontidium sp. 2 PMI_412]
MVEFFIKDEDLVGLKGKVVIITGGSSGIGLATVNLLLSLGASVVSADVTESAVTPASSFLFVRTNVAVFKELAALFKAAKEHFGRVDCVFANAGISPRAKYLALETYANGDLIEPSTEVLDVMLKSVQQLEGGSVVLMGSSTGLQPFRAPDYSTAKHGVLGFGRGYARLMEVAGLPIRINTLMPSWTATNLIQDLPTFISDAKHQAQSGMAVARAASYLMVDGSGQGDVVYVDVGKYTEIEKAVLAPAYETIKGAEHPSDDEILRRIRALTPPAAKENVKDRSI